MHRRFLVASALLSILVAVVRADEPPSPAEREASRARRRSPIVNVFERSRDAVVNIATTRVVRYQVYESIMDEFFDFARPRAQRVTSVGSGFVVHPSGYIVTNYHVVAQTSDISVIFADERTEPAKIVAVDPDHDLAVLKIDVPVSLRHLPLGRSDDIMIGESVVAIGNPYGLQHTVTTGIVSAVNRDVPFNEQLVYRGLIQTDAAINPGNSGGPLLNIDGELIGINTAIRGDAQNVGFAIPVDRLWELLPSMLDIERRQRVKFGLRISGRDAVVAEVRPDSPAAAAGLMAGDRVLKFNDEPVRDSIDYYVHLLQRSPGDKVELRFARGESQRSVTIPLEQSPPPDGAKLASTLLGATLTDIPANVRRRYGLEPDFGVYIREMDERSPLARYFATGDVIVQVNQQPASSIQSVGLALEKVTPGQPVSIVGYCLRRDPPFRRIVPVPTLRN